ncbi:MAG TPA: hypothetical protein VK430_04175 [Xanthobacteraceae bacterium]|nr:hypothetical protein [Xanthobacteraceae bacterium]
MPRKTPSLFGKHLQTALRNEQVWLKAEDLPSFLPFYVDQGHLELLLDNANQLIVGRRGTGKTHLLGAFHEFVSSEKKDSASLMISILEAYPKTPPTLQMESDEFASRKVSHEIFHGFLRVFFKRFLDLITARLRALQESCSKEDYKGIFSDANDRLTQLLEAIEIGRTYPVRSSIKSRTSESEDTDKSGGVGVGAGVRNWVPQLKGRIGLSAKKNHKKSSKKNTETEGMLSVDLFEVRELILDIIDITKINTLYILIDEWMELDKNTPSRLQAAFAQLLKATFFNSGRISVKIASVWHETTLYDRNDMERSKGIQIGHDIMLAADLDSAFLTRPEEVFEFCKRLLFKRLTHVCEELAPLQKDSAVSDVFITELFDNLDNYKAFIAASHGIPRDIMHIFQICSLHIRRNFSNNCIDFSLIADVAKNRYKQQKRKQIDPNSPAQKLLNLINKYMENSGHRLFLVENMQSGSSALRKLVDEELIHQIPSAVTHRSISDTHKTYHIDYGNYADWIATKKSDVSELLNEFVIPTFPRNFERSIKDYTINIAVIANEKGECKSCGRIFDLSHPVYMKAKICPGCAGDRTTVM